MTEVIGLPFKGVISDFHGVIPTSLLTVARVFGSAVKLAVQKLDCIQKNNIHINIPQQQRSLFLGCAYWIYLGHLFKPKPKASPKSCINLSDGPSGGQQIKYLKGLFIESKVLFGHNPVLAIYNMIISGVDIPAVLQSFITHWKETLKHSRHQLQNSKKK